jgi:tripartite-type tricarboxylate transporter receptor subunit TctC
MKQWGLTTACIALMAALIAAPARAADDDVAAFYKDRNLDFYIPTTAGGSFDVYGRLIARHLGKHMPGAPNIVVRNMPGASGFAMTNWLYNVAPRDGTAIGLPPPQIALNQIMGFDGVRFDARKFNWLFRAAPVVEVTYTWFTSPTRSFADALLRETLIGSVGPSSGGAVYVNQMNVALGAKFRLVMGYPGSTEIHLAMERGEVEGSTKPWAGLKTENADWLRDKKLQFLVQYGRERSPELPDTPTLSELAVRDIDKSAFYFLSSGPAVGRSIAAPPGVAPERVAALRDALMRVSRDPDFLRDAKAQNIDLGPLDGASLQAIVEKTYAYPAEAVARARQASGL